MDDQEVLERPTAIRRLTSDPGRAVGLAPDRRYAVTILEPLAVTRGGEEDALRAWVAALERVVRERPTQWFNFFDIWSPLGA